MKTKRGMTRVLVAVLLWGLICPAAAAEQPWGFQLTLSRLKAEMEGYAPVEVELPLFLSFTQGEEGWMAQFSLGEGGGALKGAAGMKGAEGPLRLKLEGLALETSLEALSQAGVMVPLEDAGQTLPDLEQLVELFESSSSASYQTMNQIYEDPQGHLDSVGEALGSATQEGLGQAAGEEEVAILGRQVQASRYDFQGVGQQVDRVTELAIYSDPRGLQAAQAQMAALEQFFAAGQEEDADLPNSRIQGSRWDSLDGRSLRLNYTLDLAVPQGAVDGLVQNVVEGQYHWGESALTVRLDSAIIQETLESTMEVNLEGDLPMTDESDMETHIRMRLTPNLPQQDTPHIPQGSDYQTVSLEAIELRMGAVQEDGALEAEFSVEELWEDSARRAFSLGLQTSPEEGKDQGQVYLGFEIDSDWQRAKHRYTLDVSLTQDAAWQQDVWEDLWAGEAVDPYGDLSSQQRAQLETQINALGIRLTGVFLQNPGVAQLVARFNVWLTQQSMAAYDGQMGEGWYPTV